MSPIPLPSASLFQEQAGQFTPSMLLDRFEKLWSVPDNPAQLEVPGYRAARRAALAKYKRAMPPRVRRELSQLRKRHLAEQARAKEWRKVRDRKIKSRSTAAVSNELSLIIETLAEQKAVAPLMKVAAMTGSTSISLKVYHALAKSGEQGLLAAEHALTFVWHKSVVIRLASFLDNLCPERNERTQRALLANANPQVRKVAIDKAYTKRRIEAAELRQIAQYDPSSTVRKTAWQALGDSREDLNFKAMLMIKAGFSMRERRHLASNIANSGAACVVPALVKARAEVAKWKPTKAAHTLTDLINFTIMKIGKAIRSTRSEQLKHSSTSQGLRMLSQKLREMIFSGKLQQDLHASERWAVIGPPWQARFKSPTARTAYRAAIVLGSLYAPAA